MSRYRSEAQWSQPPLHSDDAVAKQGDMSETSRLTVRQARPSATSLMRWTLGRDRPAAAARTSIAKVEWPAGMSGDPRLTHVMIIVGAFAQARAVVTLTATSATA